MPKDPYLRTLFVEGLRLVHGAHHQGAEQARANIGTSSLPKLKRMLKAGAALNLEQAKRLEPIFAALKVSPEARTDRAMGGICDTNKGLLTKCDNRQTRDLANIGSGQVAVHFYLATYGTLRAYARALGDMQAVAIFDRTLAETRAIDRTFTRLASRIVARRHIHGYPAESALYTTAAMNPGRTVAALLGVAVAGALAFAATAQRPEPTGLRRLLRR